MDGVKKEYVREFAGSRTSLTKECRGINNNPAFHGRQTRTKKFHDRYAEIILRHKQRRTNAGVLLQGRTHTFVLGTGVGVFASGWSGDVFAPTSATCASWEEKEERGGRSHIQTYSLMTKGATNGARQRLGGLDLQFLIVETLASYIQQPWNIFVTSRESFQNSCLRVSYFCFSSMGLNNRVQINNLHPQSHSLS